MTAWIVRFVLLVLLAFANLNTIWSPDVVPNSLLSWTLLRDHDVDYREFTGPPGSGLLDRGTYFFRACGLGGSAGDVAGTAHPPRSVGGPPPPGADGAVCSVFPPGIAFLALPFFAPFVLAGTLPTDLPLLLGVGHLAAAVIEALATLLLWAVLRRVGSARAALGLVLLYVCGTSVRTIASQALWQHAGVHLALALVLWAVIRPRELRGGRALLAGLALGAGAVVRQTVVLAVPALGTVARGRAALGIALGVAPLLAYNLLAFGSPLEQGYGAKPFDLAAVPLGLAGLLVAPSRGLLVYEPFTVFAAAALLLAWRRGDPVARTLRGCSLTVMGTLLLYGTYAEWWGGRVFGPRFLDDLAPILVVALGWAIPQGLLAARAPRVAFVIAAGWSLVLFTAASLVYDQRWDTLPTNVNLAPARLWDLADPQWLAVLRDLGTGGSRAVAGLVLTALCVAALARVERISSRS